MLQQTVPGRGRGGSVMFDARVGLNGTAVPQETSAGTGKRVSDA